MNGKKETIGPIGERCCHQKTGLVVLEGDSYELERHIEGTIGL